MIAQQINRAARPVPTALIYIGTLAYAAWMFWRAATGQLGPEPINALEREYGYAALVMLAAGLVITPLRTFAGVNLIRFRRSIGLSAFFLVVAHLIVWVILDVQSPARMWAAIVKQPYVTIGMASLLLLIPLAVTSNNYSIRRLGPKWRSLHKLTYPAAILGALHFLWLVKGIQIEPILFLAGISGLVAIRFLPKRQK